MSTLYPKRRQFLVPYNAKIADIQKADTAKYFLVLADTSGTGAIAGETRKIIAVSLVVYRITGTGYFNLYNNEGLIAIIGALYQGYSIIITLADGTQRLQYNQSVANDDWDLYCVGYVVEA